MRLLQTGLLLLLIAVTVVEAAPRNRRAMRRSRQATTTNNYVRSYQTTPSTSYRPADNTYVPGRVLASSVTVVPSTPTASASPAVVKAQDVVAMAPVDTPAPQLSPSDVESTGDALPSVEASESTSVAESVVVNDSQVQAASHDEPVEAAASPVEVTAAAPAVVRTTPQNSAMAELNYTRSQRGLPALIEDPALSAVAWQKASIQANRGAMFHPGGSMGGARFEGVGMGPQFITCYQYSNVGTYAGAATVVGRNGQRYHCLLIR